MPSSLAVFGGTNHSGGIPEVSSSAMQTVAFIARPTQMRTLNFIRP